jgi:hypothetical protein
MGKKSDSNSDCSSSCINIVTSIDVNMSNLSLEYNINNTASDDTASDDTASDDTASDDTTDNASKTEESAYSSSEESDDAGSIQEELVIDDTINYIDALMYESYTPINEINNQIKEIKSLSTVAAFKTGIKQIKNKFNILREPFIKPKNTAQIRKLRSDQNEEISKFKQEHKTFKCEIKYLTKKITNIENNNIVINRKDFIDNCPEYMRTKLFIVLATKEISEQKNKYLKTAITQDYLIDRLDNDESIYKHFRYQTACLQDILDCVQQVATGRDYHKFFMFIDRYDFTYFIKRVTIELKADNVNLDNIISCMPKFLNSSAKITYLRKLFNDVKSGEKINLKHIAKFVYHKQSNENYYKVFPFIVEQYKLKRDINRIMMFTDEIMFDSNIKMEPFFIYTILDALSQNEFILDNYNYLAHSLQVPQQSWLRGNASTVSDLFFKSLNIIYEINELFHLDEKVKIIDLNKKSYEKMRGVAVFYFDFSKICDKKLSKNFTNYNRKILNSKAMAKFIEDLYKIVISGLLQHETPREMYIIKLFRDSLLSQIKNLDTIIEIYENDPDLKDTARHNGKKKTRINLNNILDNLDNNTIIKDMFCCKSEDAMDFNTLCRLFRIDAYDTTHHKKIQKLKDCLSDLNIIININVDENLIILTWSQVCNVIVEFDLGDNKISKLLYAYWIELEKSFNYIIKSLQEFNSYTKCTNDDLLINEKFIKEKFDNEIAYYKRNR